MPASTYLENALIGHVYRNVTYTSPTTVYCALFTSAGSLAELAGGTLTHEVSGGAYARVAVTFGAGSGGVSNASTVTFPTATAGWGTIRYLGIMDASTAGNVLSYAQMSSDVTVNTSNTFQFNSGSLQSTVS